MKDRQEQLPLDVERVSPLKRALERVTEEDARRMYETQPVVEEPEPDPEDERLAQADAEARREANRRGAQAARDRIVRRPKRW